MYQTSENKRLKAYLVCPYINMDRAEYKAQELKQLAESNLYDVVKINVFHVKELNAKTYFGIGKAEEIRDEVEALGADVVVFDCPLTGSQLRNLGDIIGEDIIVMDRTMLILEIFAGRAKSNEGKLQVELARLKYSLPRLTTLKINAEHTMGRGSGEKLIDQSRQRIQDEIIKLEREVKEIQKHRQTTRKQRLTRMKSVALVGYTNAGKSTLMNAISKAGTYADDRLFATLDVLTKKVWDSGVEYCLIDTVGFVSDLPHELMYAFSATLEETLDADVLVMVVDSNDDHKYEQIKVVENEFKKLEIDPGRVILVYNKIDKLTKSQLGELKKYGYTTICIGAKTNKNIDELKSKIREKLVGY